MKTHFDHHMLSIVTCNIASQSLLSTQPETDVICELRELLDTQFDIIDCMNNDRHFGSDELDSIIEQCSIICAQVKELEK